MPAKYHFFGKECFIDKELSDQSNLLRCIKEKNIGVFGNVVFVNQIHSNQILIIDDQSKIPISGSLPKVDAIITNLKNLPIAVITADCVPVLLFDNENEIIAAVHSGWRGALNGIIANAIGKMIDLGADKNNIYAVIGPAIRQKSYEVSKEFYNDFLKKDVVNKQFFIISNRPDHYLFDLPKYVKNALKKANINNITDCEIDTYENTDQFFSYRRNFHLKQEEYGRNVSVIVNK